MSNPSKNDINRPFKSKNAMSTKTEETALVQVHVDGFDSGVNRLPIKNANYIGGLLEDILENLNLQDWKKIQELVENLGGKLNHNL